MANDVTNLNVKPSNYGDWQLVEQADQNAWVNVSHVDQNGTVLSEALVVLQDEEAPSTRVMAQIPDLDPAELRALGRRQTAFDADRCGFAIRAAQEIIDGLNESEAIRTSLKAVTEGVLRNGTLQSRLGRLANVNELKPMLATFLAKVTENLKQLDMGLSLIGRPDAVKALAAASGLTEEAVEVTYGAQLSQSLVELRDRILVEMPRDSETLAVPETAFGRAYNEGLQEIKQFAQRFAALHDAGCNAGLEKAEVEHLCREVLTLPSHVAEALLSFLTGGSTRAALHAAVNEVLGEVRNADANWDRLMSDVDLQPAEVVKINEAVRLLKLAQAEHNAQEVWDFSQSIVKDEALSMALGLPAMMKAKAPLTAGLRREFEARLETLKSGAEKMRAVESELRQRPECHGMPIGFWIEISDMATRLIQQGRVTDDDVAALRTKAMNLLRGETDLGVTVEIIAARHADWTNEQKQLLTETLQYLQSVMPHEKVKVYSEGVIQLEKIIGSQDAEGWLDRKAPFAEQLALLKAFSLASFGRPQIGALLKAKKAEVTALFARKHGSPSVNEVLRTIVGPKAKIEPQESFRDLCDAIVEQYDKMLFRSVLKRWPQFRTVYEEARQDVINHPDPDQGQTEAAMEQAIIARLPTSPDWLTFTTSRLQYGVKPSVAIEKFFGADKMELSDFVEIPKITLAAAGDKAKVEGQFISDFCRGTAPGSMSFEVQAPQGVVRVTDRRDDFPSEEDQARFLGDHVSSKSLAVFKALEDLCAGNEMQYRLALQTMSQGGIRSMTTLLLGKAHMMTPLAYRVTKDGQNNLIITAQSGVANDENQLSATVVVKLDGTAQYSELSVSRLQRETEDGWVEMPQMFRPAALENGDTL